MPMEASVLFKSFLKRKIFQHNGSFTATGDSLVTQKDGQATSMVCIGSLNVLNLTSSHLRRAR